MFDINLGGADQFCRFKTGSVNLLRLPDNLGRAAVPTKDIPVPTETRLKGR